MTAHTSMLHVRVDDETKEQATQALAAMGMSVSDAVRLFLRRVVVDQAIRVILRKPRRPKDLLRCSRTDLKLTDRFFKS